MNHAKIRAKVLAVEAGHHVHAHGCFGEVELRHDMQHYTPYCRACERIVPHADVASPIVQTLDYIRDVNALLLAFDNAEDEIATLEDEGMRR